MAGPMGDDDATIAEINITPFVDVVLVLLVIFMVTAGFIVNKGVKIQLPEAATAEKLSLQRTLNILVQPSGSLVLDGKPVTTQELKDAGKTSKANGEKVVALISADKGVIYSYVVGVMDTLRQVGISEFALQMEKLPDPVSP
jgi:biopolymer transport protein ExbD